MNSFHSRQHLNVNHKTYIYYSLAEAAKTLKGIERLPFSLKILLENLLRYEDTNTVTKEDINAVADWLKTKSSQHEIAYRPTRVLMQDFTGVPAIVDLAAMRDALKKLGGDPNKINPLNPVDLVIDHSVQVDQFGNSKALLANTAIEMSRNRERYEFLRWGQEAFSNFKVVPPGTGICHQVNLEYLGRCVWHVQENHETVAYPDTVVGTDSHTTMINGLGVLGWGVGGIEAEAAMLGQPISMLIPEVIGFKLTGRLQEGITATDLVLTVTQLLREKGVVGKFVEFYGSGLSTLPLADRATISNMAPEYGATCGFFPIDKETVHYLTLTGRDEETVALVEAYTKAQGLWRDENTPDPVFSDTVSLDLSAVQPSVAGPKRPQDKVKVVDLKKRFEVLLEESGRTAEKDKPFSVEHSGYAIAHGSVVIAAITSCTNTSNPSVLMAAGLLAKNAVNKGLIPKPWVKASLAPGSKVVTEYLEKADLQRYLDAVGFHLVGYGCTTCIGNSGPLPENIHDAIEKNDLIVSAVLSGNRNFEGRVHPLTKANWLASPPLVVAYALAGTTHIDLTHDPLGHDKKGHPVYLKDIWPSNEDIAHEVAKISESMFRKEYADVFKGDAQWNALSSQRSQTYAWNKTSTYVQHPPYFADLELAIKPLKDINNARILAILGDSITTDHISPAGSIKANSPAGLYLQAHGVSIKEFNSYGARRGNHEVMMRGTFANIRIRNEMTPGIEGGVTKHYPSGEVISIYDAAMRYQAEQTPVIVIAGKEYGTGSSRDWAAKGPLLLGCKAVIAESYERIHRSNLIGMGILPLQFKGKDNRLSLKLTGMETVAIHGIAQGLAAGCDISVTFINADYQKQEITVLCRIDTQNELEYFKHGGILHYVLRNLASK
ncbi:MAG: acnA [Gammaproteobacteria bacterium]|jgi:aconitate hydratase|nr:acnA [Gammaproteobacteria bacterium]